MTKYNITYTDINKNPIELDEYAIDDTSVDVTLFGRLLQNYGENVNEDLLNILENFSCPETPGIFDINSATPDINYISKKQLLNPIEGQMWFNSTRNIIYYFDGTEWKHISNRGEYAANWGQIISGQQLPKPVGVNGKIFDYNECILLETSDTDGAL